jgi:hypothetical protein
MVARRAVSTIRASSVTSAQNPSPGIEEIGNERRAQVYRTDVKFADTDKIQRRASKRNVPAVRGHDRVLLAAKILKLKDEGHTLSAIDRLLGLNKGQSSRVLGTVNPDKLNEFLEENHE